jgi:co-chaperonin GroES (HSP10)
LIKPRPGWALIEPHTEDEQVTKGGILVPDAPLMSSPIAVGKMIVEQRSDGGVSYQFVMYQKNAAQTTIYNGKTFLMVPDSAIIADIEI